MKDPVYWSSQPCAHVLRGGSYWSRPDLHRVSHRFYANDHAWFDLCGFRLCRYC